MSIPGVGPLAGQVAQEATVSLCSRFVNLFQNRIAAAAAIALTSILGGLGSLRVGNYIIKQLTKKGAVQLIYASGFTTGLVIMVAKCLNLPFTSRATAGIAIGSIVLSISLSILALAIYNAGQNARRR